MSELNPLSCPRCGRAGDSVAALAAAETQHQRANGRFSGSGVGFGTFGIGVGVGGGSYAEDRTAQSGRARLFAAPKPIRLSFEGWRVLGLGLASAFALGALPEVLGAFGGDVREVLAGFQPTAGVILGVIGALAAAASLWRCAGLVKAHQAAEVAVNEHWPARQARYAELRYCESCHVVFDGEGRSETADEAGFGRMSDPMMGA